MGNSGTCQSLVKSRFSLSFGRDFTLLSFLNHSRGLCFFSPRIGSERREIYIVSRSCVQRFVVFWIVGQSGHYFLNHLLSRIKTKKIANDRKVIPDPFCHTKKQEMKIETSSLSLSSF